MHASHISFTNYSEISLVHFLISIAFDFFICYKGLPRIIFKLLHFYGKFHLRSKSGLKKQTIILILLALFSWYVNTYEHIATYNCRHAINEVIVTYGNKRTIGQKEIYELFVYLVKS